MKLSIYLPGSPKTRRRWQPRLKASREYKSVAIKRSIYHCSTLRVWRLLLLIVIIIRLLFSSPLPLSIPIPAWIWSELECHWKRKRTFFLSSSSSWEWLRDWKRCCPVRLKHPHKRNSCWPRRWQFGRKLRLILPPPPSTSSGALGLLSKTNVHSPILS